MSASAANLYRRLADANLIKVKALPAAAAANAGDSIDLGQITLGPLADILEAILSIEALPSLVDAKTVILTISDSADNASFTAIPSLATLVLTGAGGVGAGAAERRFKLPPSTRQYIRAEAAVLTAGGDNTAKKYTLKILANS